MAINKSTSSKLILPLFFIFWSTYAQGEQLYFVDAHSQADHKH